MKRLISIWIIFLTILLLAVSLTGCTRVAITTKDATNVTSVSAELNGFVYNIEDDSFADVCFYWEEYRDQDEFSPHANITDTVRMTDDGYYTATITGLSPDTTYHFMAYIASASGSGIPGNVLYFTTNPEEPPADIITTWLYIRSDSTWPGVGIEVQVTVENRGGSGTREIVLIVDGQDEYPMSVTLAGHTSSTKSFFVSSHEIGVHTVEIDGYTDQFEVRFIATLTVGHGTDGSVREPGVGLFNYFNEDEVVNLVAEADEGYQFERWHGDVADPDSATTTVTMDADKTVIAYFIPIIPVQPMVLTSSAFTDGGAIPSNHAHYYAGGSNISPPLAWTGVPENTQSFVLIMKDPVGWDGPCVHWIVFNIPSNVTSLEQGVSSNLPEGIFQGRGNDAFGYYGCEPLEGQLHEYYFTIYALDTMLDLSQGATEQQVLNAMEGHIIDQAVLVGTYQG